MILIQRKFLFLALLYSGLLACHLQTSANAMDKDKSELGNRSRAPKYQQIERDGTRATPPKESNFWGSLCSGCCENEDNKDGFAQYNSPPGSPEQRKDNNSKDVQTPVRAIPFPIESVSFDSQGVLDGGATDPQSLSSVHVVAPATHTQPSVEIPVLPRKVSFEVEEDLEDGDTDPQHLSSSQVNEEIAAFSVSLSIKESASSQILEDPIIRDYITSLLNSQTPSLIEISLMNEAENCLGNAKFCTYAVGTQPELPSPKSSKSSVKDNQAMKPLLDNQPFSEKMIGKMARSIQGMQIEDIAWTYAEHFFNELKKKKDGNVFFFYYGYKLPEAHAFARIITPTIVYDLTLPRKEGTGSVATSNTKSSVSVSSKKNGQATQPNIKD